MNRWLQSAPPASSWFPAVWTTMRWLRRRTNQFSVLFPNKPCSVFRTIPIRRATYLRIAGGSPSTWQRRRRIRLRHWIFSNLSNIEQRQPARKRIVIVGLQVRASGHTVEIQDKQILIFSDLKRQGEGSECGSDCSSRAYSLWRYSWRVQLSRSKSRRSPAPYPGYAQLG